MINPKVTVAIPVYGVEKYIEVCARSVFEQTYDNLEFLFVNDCTKDGSFEVLENVLLDYPNRRDQVIIIEHSFNRGLSAARNTAVEHAKGDFIFHVDSDDYIEKDAIESLINKQQQEDADLVVGNYIIELGDGRTLYRKYLDITQTKEKIVVDCLNDVSSHSVWGILIKKSLYIDNCIRALEGVNVGEDWQVASQILYYASKIAYIDGLTYHYVMSRTGSYTIEAFESVTKKKNSLFQFVQTLDFMLEKFSNKGEQYIDIINQKRAVLIQDAMIYSCMDHDKESFDRLYTELKKVGDKYVSLLGNNSIIVRILKKNYYTFSFLLLIKKKMK